MFPKVDLEGSGCVLKHYLNIASIIRLKRLKELQAGEEKVRGGGDFCHTEFC